MASLTSDKAEEYFSNIDRHRIPFIYDNDENDNENIFMEFNGKAIDQRKEWLITHMDNCEHIYIPKKRNLFHTLNSSNWN